MFNLTSIADHSELLNLPEYAGGEDLKVNEVHLNGQYIYVYVYFGQFLCVFHQDELRKNFVFTISVFCSTF